MTSSSSSARTGMLLGLQFGNGYGSQPDSWRMPGVDPAGYTDFDAMARHARAAERGLIDFLFLPDGLGLDDDIEHHPPKFSMEPILTLAAVARATSRIGLVMTASSTYNDAYSLARQLKTLDVMSHGRVGWNAVPSSGDLAAGNFGRAALERQEKYERLHEMVQIMQGLWGSWGEDAWIKDAETGRFADASKVRAVNMAGRHVASRGPLAIPPSEQGQPVIFQAGGGGNGAAVAGRYANGVIGATFSIDDARAQRTMLRRAAAEAGRDPDEVKFFAGVMPALGRDRRDALDRRLLLGRDTLPQRVPYLGLMLNLRLSEERLATPLTAAELAAARPSPGDPRAGRALEVAREGWTVREILAHGVIDYHPTPVGSAADIADHLQEWYEAGAVDGFWVSVDVYEDGIDAFVDQVVPVLQDRGLFHHEYEGTTLRDHLGAPHQYGLDPRLS
ncbi:NtaA/DmoA family FMN-dependent monooxygenase [Rathayibacter sp. ZW T2_19]|uniref:NtaA/DmoA family FMN-dependent monooxygenase n=1 Tax=Rathayibacter rubneri TaxID=2950106 RepID=A0A9X2E1R2_9MICO|nr:NtaA/DmoA family FMN-dependent monooxygenase [Rathayibacter rubneri]MCM6762886.1 NtaA/DmoA family FMN-dependent monooxygenase [Rathayibacter rubneri]